MAPCFSAGLRPESRGVNSSLRLATALGLAAIALGTSRPALAAEPGEVQKPPAAAPDYPSPSARGTHLVAGAVVFGAWYGGALGASLLWPDAPGAEDLRIPVAGPWMALGDTGCAEDDPDCSTVLVVIRAVLTGIDGVGQAGGLLVMAEGLFLPTREARPSARSKAQSFAIRPSAVATGKDGIGLGISGVF
jgi:hypothetical protein